MKTEAANQIREDVTQIRLSVGEKLGQMPPDVQVKMNQVLDACERIDRAAQHGVGPGEPPPAVAPGVPGDGFKQPLGGEAKAATAKAAATKSVASAEDRPRARR